MKNPENFWNRIADKNDKKEVNHEKSFLEIIKNVKKHLKLSDTVLDFACGTGTKTSEIAGNVKKIYAIDTSPKMIEVAKKRVEHRNVKNIQFMQTTIFDQRYKNESFDVIIAFNILHLLDDPQKNIQRINQLLKPGGIFISSTACLGEKKSFFTILLFLIGKMRIVPYMTFFKISELKKLVTEKKFKIVESKEIYDNLSNLFIVAKKSLT